MYNLEIDLKPVKNPAGFFTVYDVLTDEEIDTVIEVGKKNSMMKGTINVSGGEEEDVPDFISYDNDKPGYRDSGVVFFKYQHEDELGPIHRKIANQIIEVNRDIFRYHLTDLEPFQFTSYKIGEYYKQHTDAGEGLYLGGIVRKLSAVIQLSDSDDYTGGNLLGYVQEKPIAADRKKGSMTFFPSFLLHEVTPVTLGHRYSLVMWVLGPRFI